MEHVTLPATNTSSRPVSLLTFTTLYPHRGRPNHGIFVENRLRNLVATGGATSTVVAPVPWFPSAHERFGDWGLNARAEREEIRHDLRIFHPRYKLIPKFGMSIAPSALIVAGIRQIRRLRATGIDFDIIDAHYIYPDGVAAVALGKIFGKPVVLTARGSDITQYPDYALPRRMIRWAMDHAASLISVSSGLRDAMISLGAPADKVTVLRNGVDLDLFQPLNAETMRTQWGVTGPVLLSVGHLITRKRHHLAIQALSDLPDWSLMIVGEGPERRLLEDLASELGVRDRVVFCGAQPHSALPAFYSAADVLILASSREGWANVLLEAMACGTPVVVSNIPGNPEVVRDQKAGFIVDTNTAEDFAKTIKRLYASNPDRAATRRYAEDFGWDATSQGQLDLFRKIIGRVS